MAISFIQPLQVPKFLLFALVRGGGRVLDPCEEFLFAFHYLVESEEVAVLFLGFSRVAITVPYQRFWFLVVQFLLVEVILLDDGHLKDDIGLV